MGRAAAVCDSSVAPRRSSGERQRMFPQEWAGRLPSATLPWLRDVAPERDKECSPKNGQGGCRLRLFRGSATQLRRETKNVPPRMGRAAAVCDSSVAPRRSSGERQRMFPQEWAGRLPSATLPWLRDAAPERDKECSPKNGQGGCRLRLFRGSATQLRRETKNVPPRMGRAAAVCDSSVAPRRSSGE